jgi:hypothetical protein
MVVERGFGLEENPEAAEGERKKKIVAMTSASV